MSLAELQRELERLELSADRANPTRASPSSSCAARARACGTSTATSTSTSCAGSPSRTSATAIPRVVAAVREQAGRLMHVGNLFYTEPAMRLAERLSRSSLGGKVFFCNSGAEAIEAAIKLARKARPGGTSCRPRRLPRPHLRRAVGDPAGVKAGAVRAARPRLSRGRRRRPRRSPARSTSTPPRCCSSRSRARPA